MRGPYSGATNKGQTTSPILSFLIERYLGDLTAKSMNREILFTALLSVWFNCLFGQTNQPSPTDIGYLWNELQTVCADSAHEFLCMATANDELETVCKTAFSNALADISEGKVLYNAVFTDFVHSKSLHLSLIHI